MDNLTHGLVGALIGQAGLKRKTGLAMPALIIGANLPDIDAACFLWLDGVEHLGFRRGITHGPIAWLLLPLLLAGLLYGWDRWQAKRGQGRFGRPEGRLPVHFGWLYALSFIACLTHPALDWLNVYGIRLLEPFSSRWFYGDVLFIIDLWLWAIMGIGLWLSLRREKRGGEWKSAGRVTLVIALAYIAMNGVISWVTRHTVGTSYVQAIALPGPVEFWQRDLIGNAGSNPKWDFLYAEEGRDFPIPVNLCRFPDPSMAGSRSEAARAFLFWSRAPFAERALDSSVLLRDARFYDPRARDRFTVALPDVKCEPLP